MPCIQFSLEGDKCHILENELDNKRMIPAKIQLMSAALVLRDFDSHVMRGDIR